MSGPPILPHPRAEEFKRRIAASGGLEPPRPIAPEPRCERRGGLAILLLLLGSAALSLCAAVGAFTLFRLARAALATLHRSLLL